MYAISSSESWRRESAVIFGVTGKRTWVITLASDREVPAILGPM